MGLFGHHSTPPPPFPSSSTLKMWIETIQSIFLQELNREVDSDGLAGYLVCAYQGWDSDKIRESVKNSVEYKNLHNPDIPLPSSKIQQMYPIGIDGTLFHDVNRLPIPIKGFTSFQLLDKYAKGQDIRPILNAYEGFNTIRVFLYTPVAFWGDTAWGIPTNDETLDFIHFLDDNSFSLFLTLGTDNDASLVSRIKDLIKFLSGRGLKNLIIELVNEPGQHDKYDPQIFKSDIEATDLIFSSGIYEDNRKFFGRVWSDHPSSDQWWRRGHNLMEAKNGGGPNYPDEPALHIPCFGGELARPDQTAYDFMGYYMYAASCVMFGCGGVFHSQSGKYSNPLTSDEANCKDWYLKGLNVFPTNLSSVGGYRHIVENDEPDGSRTYVMGNYSLRIKQKGINHPESGWKPLDSFGIAWVRS